MGALSERVANIKDATSEIVTIPEWGGLQVEVRSLTLAERNRISTASTSKKGVVDVDRYYAATIIATCWDPETGEKAFDATDVRMLQSKNGGALDRLAKTAMRLSGLLDEEKDDEKDDDESPFAEAVNEAGKASSSSETSEPGSF